MLRPVFSGLSARFSYVYISTQEFPGTPRMSGSRERQRAAARELVRRIQRNAELTRHYGLCGERKGQRYAEALQSLLRYR